VREFVAYVAWLKEMPAAGTPAAVERAVARVGLADRLDAKLRTLSGGMIRRVGIAQAIVNDPQVLLLDEPTAGLDPEQRVEFRELLRELGASATVVVSTHLVEDVTAACTEVTLIDAGRVAYRGTPESLAALGETAAGVIGDNPIERGYTAALRAHREHESAAAHAARTLEGTAR
jgi:ABC-type multidrug transport system ATPase subunit